MHLFITWFGFDCFQYMYLQYKSPLDQTLSRFMVGWFNYEIRLTLISNCLSSSPLDLTPILAKILTSDPYKP